jgi:broad specificity phosphatase PhoE
MPDHKIKGQEVTDPAILAQLNSGSTTVQKEEVTDPAILAQLNSENNPQKKSPVQSGSASVPSSSEQQSGVTTGNPQQPYAYTGPEDVQGVKPAPVTTYSTVTPTAPKAIGQPVASTKQAVENIATDYLKANTAVQPFNPDDNTHPLMQLTDPNGDPKVLGNYVQARVKQMQTQYGLKSNPEIENLKASADYIVSQQLANKSYNLKNSLPVTANSGQTLQPIEYGAQPPLVPFSEEGINIEKAKEGQAAATAEEPYNAVRIGLEKKALTGDKIAQRDLAKYTQGLPIDPDRKVDYQAEGLNTLQTGALEAAATQDIPKATELNDNSDNIQQRLEKDNPKYFKKQWGNQVGSYIYNNVDNPIYRTLFSREQLTPDEIQQYGKAAGLKKYQIDQLTPEDVPTSSSIYGQAAQAAYNSFLLKNENDPGGKIFIGDIPIEQRQPNNWRGVVGEIASGAGTVGGFVAQSALLGGALEGTELLGNVAKNANAYEHTANLVPLAASNYNNSYRAAKDIIGDEPGDEGKRQLYAITNATLSTALMALSPATQLGKDALGGEAGKDFVKLLTKTDLADLTPEAYKDAIAKSVQNIALQSGETAKHVASQAFIMGANQIADNLTKKVFDPEHRTGLMDNVGQAALSGGISMFIPSLLAGVNAGKGKSPMTSDIAFEVGTDPDKYTTQVNQLLQQGKITPDQAQQSHDAILTMQNVIATTPTENSEGQRLTINQVKDYAYNRMQENALQKKIDGITQQSEGSNIPVDEAQISPLKKKIGELQKEQGDILKNAGQIPPEDSKIVVPNQERSVATDGQPEQQAPATKKVSEKLGQTEENNIPLTPSEETQQKTTENEKINRQRNRTESDGQISANAEEHGQENPDAAQAENSSRGSNPQEDRLLNPEYPKETQATPSEQPLPVSRRSKRAKMVFDEDPEIPVIVTPELQTRDDGAAKGQPEAQTEDKLHEAMLTAPDKPVDHLLTDKATGESPDHFVGRISDAMQDYTKPEDKGGLQDNTLLVTHSNVIKLLNAAYDKEAKAFDFNKPDLLEKVADQSTEVGNLYDFKIKDADGNEKTLQVARHGETDSNLNDLQRKDNDNLTQAGKDDAVDVANKLKEKGIAPPEILSSDLPRAKQSADIIQQELSNQGTEDVKPETRAEWLPPQPDKPLHEMTGEELGKYHDELKKFNKNIEKKVLGDDYEAYKRAQTTSNSLTASRESQQKADKVVDEIEKKLTPEQENALFGMNLPKGIIADHEEVRDYRDKVEYIEMAENENELSRYIAQSLIDLSHAPADVDEMNHSERLAFAAMKTAKRVIEERGYDGANVTREALKNAADKFRDPEDAEFVLSKYIEFGKNNQGAKTKKISEDASTQSEEQQPEGSKPSGESEHARTEQAGSETTPVEAKAGDSVQRSEGEQKKEVKEPTGEQLNQAPEEDSKEIRDAIVQTKKGGISDTEYDAELRKANSLREKAKLLENKSDVESQGRRYDLLDQANKIQNEATAKIAPFEKVVDTESQMLQVKSRKYNEAKCRELSKKHQEKYGGKYEEVDVTNPDGTVVKHAIVVHGDYVYEPQSDALIKKGVFDDYFNTNTTGEKQNQAPEEERSVATNAQPEEKVSATEKRLAEIEEDLKKQIASQKLEHQLRSKAEKEKNIPEANKHNENWYKKQERIDKLNEEQAALARDQEIKQGYNDFADKLQAKYEKNKKQHEGVASATFLGLSHKIADPVADFLSARTFEAIRELGNVHVAIRRAIRLTKEHFGEEAKALNTDDEAKIREHFGEFDKHPDSEPTLPIDQEEYAKDILADIKDGKMTYADAEKEVSNEIIENRTGQPASDHVQEKNKAKILNYIKWHVVDDTTSIKNDTTRLKRAQFGLNEEVPAAKKEFGETWNDAIKKIEKNPQAPQALIQELSEHPRPVTDVENAILLHQQNTKEIKLLDLNKKINEAAEQGDQAAVVEYKTAKAATLDELQQIYDVNKAVGTENARGLASRRMMVDRKYSLVNMLAEKRATANDGEPLSEEQQAQVEKFHQKIQETQDAFDNYVKDQESRIIDLQRQVLSQKVKDKKTASEKLRAFADKIEAASKNQAYSSPIPITPKMVAEAIRAIAAGVEKGEQLVDLVKKAVAGISQDNPGIDERHLEKEINKNIIDAGILEPTTQSKTVKDMSGFFANGRLNREAIRLKVEADRAKAEHDIQLKKDQQKQLSALAKARNFFIKWERAFKLSNPITLGKLANAALSRMFLTTPAEDIVGGAYSKAIPKLATGAIGEGGGLNVGETARAYKTAFTRGIEDMREIMKKESHGKSELDVLYGKGGDLPPEAIDFFGQIHSAIKAPAKRFAFERSVERRLRNTIAGGGDVTDPLVQTSIMTGAYKDANRAIFMQDNAISDWWQSGIRSLEKGNAQKGKSPSPGAAAVMQWMVPFVKVPTNIVAETARSIYGLPAGAGKLLHTTFTKGIENLSEDEKDIVLRNLKKGTLGAAALALGYFNPQNFGGYYQPGQKRDEDDAAAGGMKFGDQKIPAWFVESPIFQVMQFGATIRRVKDQMVHGEENGIGEGIWAASIGLVQNAPLAGQPVRLAKIFASPGERNYYFGELAKSTIDPALLNYVAEETDPTSGTMPGRLIDPQNKRKARTIGEHVESGIPGLRENLEEK